jgi:hypothetical protein
VFFWFVTFAVLVVVAVFDSPAMDYRYVAVGSVIPVIEVAIGHPYIFHTLVGSVASLLVVVIATRGRRLAARRFVGLPIGLFLHLVADGTWSRAKLFWWPFLGTSAFGTGEVPERAHLGVSLGLEVVGVIATVWIVRRYGLEQPAPRQRFLRSGRLATTPKDHGC